MKLPQTLLPFLLLLSISLSAQRYSKVKITLDASHDLTQLAQLGLETEHGNYQPGRFFTGEYSETEIAAIQAAGFSTEILISDLKANLLELNRLGASVLERSAPPCQNGGGGGGVQTPENYAYGTMAGYYKYQEMLDILDSMAAKYPDLFKPKSPLHPTLTTFEERPLYWVKISDSPADDEADEPEIFFNAVHHAREPNSMSQMIFFMWHLLENYDSDPEVKFLVDHTEIYFVPCVNPDGYIYNETTNPDGGGFWRKNRRLNADGTYGVDLNRNYGYAWGLNDSGSSGNTSSEVYRGTAPFSEPETQMIREFCIAHEFVMTFNYHTYSNLLIHSWDYDFVYTPDHDLFIEYGDYMTEENGYLNGIAGEVLYLVNGGANDWNYGEQTEKNKILSFLPEVGYSFWPLQTDIDPLNKDAFEINIKALRLLHNYGIVTPANGRFINELNGEIGFSLQKLGMGTGSLTVSLTPLSGNVASVDLPKDFNLSNLETTNDAFAYTLDASIENGDSVIFELTVGNGNFSIPQKVVRIFTAADEAFFDPGDDLSQWDPNTAWEATTEDFFSAPSCITDSKNSSYPVGSLNELVLNEPIGVNNASHVFLSFWAKWDIEEDQDFAQVSVSVEGSQYFPLCGSYTEAGTVEQFLDSPLYDGTQSEWVFEEMDLSEYLAIDDSLELSFLFGMYSDEFLEYDGFYFDDLTLTVVEENTTSVIPFDETKFSVSSRPNPAGDYVVFDLEGISPNSQFVEIEVFNAFGQQVQRLPASGKTARLDVSDWAAGVYFYRVLAGGKMVTAKRFVVG